MIQWLKELRLRILYATREPYDLDGNRKLLAEIDRMSAERATKNDTQSFSAPE